MISHDHAQHLLSNISHAACSECQADCQRQFAMGNAQPWRYGHVREYLEYIRPRLAAIREERDRGGIAGRRWEMDFMKALHTRISLKGGVFGRGRKHNDGYRERLRGMYVACGPECRIPDAAYLRRFASRGASCLDYR